jgi:tRNA modification GTPase
MLNDFADTIVALSSPQGPGMRAIVRLSGPSAWKISAAFFPELKSDKPAQRLLHTSAIKLPDLNSGLPGDLYFWPAPRTYTGQDVAEIHTLSSPPLVDLLISLCLNAGARAAGPGEFTLRAFIAGKLDLTKAEAILGIIEAADGDELKQALVQLAGGVGQPLRHLREDLLNLLADVEAGLDFTDEDIQFVRQKEMLDRLARALALVTLIRRQIEQRATGPKPFRAVLAGPPNAGKSSLFNALAGKDAALVSPRPGTTRDYLEATLFVNGLQVSLIDTAGLDSSRHHAPRDVFITRSVMPTMDEAAQAFSKEQAESADLLLWCCDANVTSGPDWREWFPDVRGERIVKVATKCDLALAPPGHLATSARGKTGLEELKELLARRSRERKQSALAPSLSRCRHHVDACLEHLRQAHNIALHEDPVEVLALELRGALEELGAMTGAIYTEDLLDRIFSRFCIGK